MQNDHSTRLYESFNFHLVCIMPIPDLFLISRFYQRAVVFARPIGNYKSEFLTWCNAKSFLNLRRVVSSWRFQGIQSGLSRFIKIPVLNFLVQIIAPGVSCVISSQEDSFGLLLFEGDTMRNSFCYFLLNSQIYKSSPAAHILSSHLTLQFDGFLRATQAGCEPETSAYLAWFSICIYYLNCINLDYFLTAFSRFCGSQYLSSLPA